MIRAFGSSVSVVAVLLAVECWAENGSSSDDHVVCTGGGATREIAIRHDSSDRDACRVEYTKDGATSTVWSARHDRMYCSRNAEQLRQKLVAAGFSCRSTVSDAASTAAAPPAPASPPAAPVSRAQSLLPGGFLVRPVQAEDIKWVREVCPEAQWQQSRFTCSRNDWAPWVGELESADIPPEKLQAYRAFVSGRDFVARPMNGVVVFPDVSSHLILDGFDASTGASAVWLIDPVHRVVDLMWVTGQQTLYFGPHAMLLKQNQLDADSLKMGAARLSVAK